MRPLRALVVDDEPLGRNRLVRLLRRENGVEVVGTAAGGREAISAIASLSPDLVFLDIEMPEVDGFAVVAALSPESRPATVFVTAFDRYAIRAFDVRAVDYLLKPVTPSRLNEAVARVASRRDRPRQDWDAVCPAPPAGEAEGELLAGSAPPLHEPAHAACGPLTRLVVRQGEKIYLLRVADVDWFEAEGNYVRLHVGTRTHLVRATLSALEQRLARGEFARVHRSTIVNLDRVKEIHTWFGGDYIVVLRDGTELRMSRKYRERILQPMA